MTQSQATLKQGRLVPLTTKLFTMEVLPNGVAVVTYDVPGEAINTLQANTTEEFESVLFAIEGDSAVRAVVLLSGKPDSFVAGANLDMLKKVKTAVEAERLSRRAQAGFAHLASMKKPVVAAIHGPCLGGGFELALACHGRVASDDEKTTFGLPEVQLGLLPGADGLQRIAAITGITTALDLGLTGKSVPAVKAKKLGLVDEVCSKSILREIAVEYALQLVVNEKPKGKGKRLSAKQVETWALEKNPIGRAILFKKAREQAHKKSQGHYPAIDRIIDILETYAREGMVSSREVVARAFGELAVGETAARLIEIFFATNALKKDTGIDDPSVKPRQLHKVAILGAGLMGAGISYVTGSAGISVRLKDKDDQGLGHGLKYISDIFQERVRRGQLSPMDKIKKMALISGTIDYRGIGNADVVIEAVFEDLSLKQRVLKEVEEHTSRESIFASNTSSIPIAKIAAASSHPETVIGMHYFSPVHKMPLLEVVKTKETAPWVVATAVSLGKKQGKIVIVVNDGVGFYTSRVLSPYMNEAAYLLAEGVPIDEIDRSLMKWGWPVGPMALLDEVGIDVAAHVGLIMVEALGERLAPPPTVSKLVSDNRKGRKNERGLYLYGEAAKNAKKTNPFGKKRSSKSVDESVYSLLGVEPKPNHIAMEEIQMRCSLQFINEALYCFAEGVLRTVRDGDIGAVFGLGFPAFRGGPFRYVDSVGAQEILHRISAYEDRFGKRWSPAPVLVEMARKGAKFYSA